MVLMLTADHGPAVSGAMNTIVATRAGKDLISSLASGLLTIGSRFGGALDEAAAMFSNARDTGLTPREFVDSARKQNKLSAYFSFPSDDGLLTVSLRVYSQRYRPQDQERQQPRSSCRARQGVRPQELPLALSPRLRPRRREGHHRQEGHPHPERRWMHRCVLRRFAPGQWSVHRGGG